MGKADKGIFDKEEETVNGENEAERYKKAWRLAYDMWASAENENEKLKECLKELFKYEAIYHVDCASNMNSGRPCNCPRSNAEKLLKGELQDERLEN